MDEARFEAARDRIVGSDRQREGIGTLSEKTVHAVLKWYYAPDEATHERPLAGYVADIYTGEEVIEIQTRSFERLREKLDHFLLLCPVTLVYPIPYEKWVVWIDEETGEMSKRRRSPRKGSAYLAFRELYRIKEYLTHENLHLRLVLIDMEEYRLLNGWSRDKKKGSTRFDRIPLRLSGEIRLDEPRDYLQLFPYELKEPFTVKELGKYAHITEKQAQYVVQVCSYLKVLSQTGKRGRAYEYQVMED